MTKPIDAAEFIRTNTRLQPVRALPEIELYTAHEATGLWRLAQSAMGAEAPAPYWAFPWAGGMAIARHIIDRPETVRGLRVLDLGSGSGLVAIAAALAGAARVTAAEIDPYGVVAVALNAAANGVVVDVLAADVLPEAAPEVDVVTVGDLFYEEDLAKRVTAFLDRCLAAGVSVLIGDPRRAYLPYSRLRLLAEYPVPDVGEVEGTMTNVGAVFALTP